MPREDRRIIFENEEVYKALYALCAQKQQKKPPPGLITEIIEDAQDSSVIHMAIENPQEKTDAKLDYSRDFLAAALMLYCRGLGIPLPKRAQKSVVIKDSIVMLRVQV